MSKFNTAINTFIDKTFEAFKNQLWFKFLCGIIIFLGSCVILVGINNYTIKISLDKYKQEESIQHQNNFIRSRELYNEVKLTLKNYIPLTNSQYIFLLEYHNGNENIITGVQFCKFDVTLELVVDSIDWISMNKMQDDIIAKYDILTDSRLVNNQYIFCDIQQVKDIDRYLYNQLITIDAQEVAIVNLTDHQGVNYGSIAFVNMDQNTKLDRYEIMQCRHDVEKIFNKR